MQVCIFFTVDWGGGVKHRLLRFFGGHLVELHHCLHNLSLKDYTFTSQFFICSLFASVSTVPTRECVLLAACVDDSSHRLWLFDDSLHRLPARKKKHRKSLPIVVWCKPIKTREAL